MFNKALLNAEFAAHNTTGRKVSQQIGMNERTFYTKMNTGKWSVSEARAIIKTVGIDPMRGAEIFLSLN